jgi:hypothetical protein
MMQPDKKKIESLLKSRKAIVVDTAFVKTLGFDDMRDFAQSIGDWGYVTDFTYRDNQTENWQLFLRRYLKECFTE